MSTPVDTPQPRRDYKFSGEIDQATAKHGQYSIKELLRPFAKKNRCITKNSSVLPMDSKYG